MVKSVAKGHAWMRDLKEKLEFRFKGSATIDTFAEAKDTDGYAQLTLSLAGAVAAANDVMFIRVKSEDAVSKDVFGNDLISFTPHVIQFAYELDGVVPEVGVLDIYRVLQEVLKLGIKCDIFEIADGTAVTAANVDLATAVLEIEPDLIWPTKGM
jgi:hypothetical protein